ncbi:hypothetical protein D5086_006286 [Populus alba]|uniref:Uncharacterized protein n=1 Tax=Populus alba TaxID=43335 RepID=A0ACC4CMB3_POPAL
MAILEKVIDAIEVMALPQSSHFDQPLSTTKQIAYDSCFEPTVEIRSGVVLRACHLAQQFTDIVTVAERIEVGVKSGRISAPTEKKRASKERKKGGHSIHMCSAFKKKLIYLIKAGWITFEETPNMSMNPLLQTCQVIYYFNTPALEKRHQSFGRVKFLASLPGRSGLIVMGDLPKYKKKKEKKRHSKEYEGSKEESECLKALEKENECSKALREENECSKALQEESEGSKALQEENECSKALEREIECSEALVLKDTCKGNRVLRGTGAQRHLKGKRVLRGTGAQRHLKGN